MKKFILFSLVLFASIAAVAQSKNESRDMAALFGEYNIKACSMDVYNPKTEDYISLHKSFFSHGHFFIEKGDGDCGVNLVLRGSIAHIVYSEILLKGTVDMAAGTITVKAIEVDGPMDSEFKFCAEKYYDDDTAPADVVITFDENFNLDFSDWTLVITDPFTGDILPFFRNLKSTYAKAGMTEISTVEADATASDNYSYNLQGVRVDGNYNGVEIEGGKKVIRK